MNWLPEAVLAWSFAAFYSIADVAVVAVCSHGFTPPRVAKARMEQAATRALDDSAHSPLGDAIGLRTLRGGDVVRDRQGLGCRFQLARPVGVKTFHF